MKRSISFLIVMLTMIVLAGCTYRGRDLDLYRMVVYNVPCTFSVNEGETADTEVVEKDSYGRRLFSYSMYRDKGFNGYERICIYAICQKSDKNYAYFYEDIFFIIADSFESFEEGDIENLKKLNDWDQPLNQDRLAKTSMDTKYTNYRRQINSREIFESTILENTDLIASPYLVNVDKNEKVFYYVGVSSIDKEGIAKYHNSYFMMLNSDGSYDPDNFVVEIEDIYNYHDQMRTFKKKNGWSFQTNIE